MFGNEGEPPDKIYNGDQTHCLTCGREIQAGDVIEVYRGGDFIFCKIDPDDPNNPNGCVIRWVESENADVPDAAAVEFEEMLYRKAPDQSSPAPSIKLPQYGGPKFACDHCHKEFQINQIILAEIEKRLAFCDSEPGPNSCCVQWSVKGVILHLRKMRFHNT